MKRPDIEKFMSGLSRARQGNQIVVDFLSTIKYALHLEAENARLEVENHALEFKDNVLGKVLHVAVIRGEAMYKTELINQELGEHPIG